MIRSGVFVFLSVIFFAGSCGVVDGKGANGKFDGIMSFNTNLQSGETTANYAVEYGAASAIGMRGAQTVMVWGTANGMENPGGTFTLYNASNSFYGLSTLAGRGFTILMTISPIIAGGTKALPTDISANTFDNATTIARFHTFIQQLLPYINSSVRYISIGNEVDSYLNANPTEWAQFRTFYSDAVAYLHSVVPWVKVGVTFTTLEGLFGTFQADVLQTAAIGDFVTLTYYPVSTGFITYAASSPLTDIPRAVALLPNKPIVFQEVGYPSSSTVIGGSEQKQSDFISYFFQTWRQIGSEKIPFVSFFKWRDYSGNPNCPGSAGSAAYEFLCSLGLKRNNFTTKLAYDTLVFQAKRIGIR